MSTDLVAYTTRPQVSDAKLARVTNLLAHWLPSDDDASSLACWSKDDWLAAEWIVYWQSALPWFVARLRATNASVPSPVQERLSALDAASRERTQRMLDGVAELLYSLNEEGVQAIPFKGAALAPLYYPEPCLRPMGDLDILVHEKDLPAGIQVLQRLGYRFFSRSAEDVVYLRGERKENVWAPDNVHPVEMHFALREEYAGLTYDLAGQVWQASSRQPYWAGLETLVPSPATLLHHVCAHASSDWLIQRGRLMHIDDIFKLATSFTLADWQAFSAEIEPNGARFVYPALAFALKYARCPVPSQVVSKLASFTPRPLIDWIARTELADTSLSNPAPRDGLGFDIVRLLAASPGERIRMWWRSLFPRRWNLAKRYPRLVEAPVWPLCYALLNADRLWHITRKRLQRV